MEKFNLGGTADSSESGGANIGGTLGSSMMRRGGVAKVTEDLHQKVRKLLGDIAANNNRSKILIQDRIDNFYDNFNKKRDYSKALDFILTYEANDKGKTINQNNIMSIEKELQKAGVKIMKDGGALKGKQKNLDLNKNGKLDSEDFKMIRGRMKTGGSVGDNHTVTLETFEIYMPKFQTYLKSKNIKFKKHNNSQEVDYYGTHSSLKSMIDKWWAMDSDKEEKQEYYNLIEKTTKMKTGGSVDSHYEKIVKDNWEDIAYAWETGGKKVPSSISNSDAEDFLNDFVFFEDMNEKEKANAITKFKNAFKSVRVTKMKTGGEVGSEKMSQDKEDAMTLSIGLGKGFSPEEFGEYIEDYYKNPEEYDIDVDSEYYAAIEAAWGQIADEHGIPAWQKVTVKSSPIFKEYSKMANGGGLADVPESFPETDAMSYKDGGGVGEVVKGKYYNIYDPGMDIWNDWEYISYTPGYHTFREEAPMGGGTEIKFTDEELKNYLKENLIKNSYKNGGQLGATKGFEYSIGGL